MKCIYDNLELELLGKVVNIWGFESVFGFLGYLGDRELFCTLAQSNKYVRVYIVGGSTNL
jgi:hypothetical protein